MSREMKNSGVEWIGNIPNSWNIVKAKYVFENHKEIAGKNEKKYDRLSLTLNGVLKRPREDAKGLQSESLETYQILQKGELVFKMIDLNNVSTSRVGYSLYEGLVSPVYIIFNNPKYSRFGYYYFFSMWQREIYNHLGNDGVRSSLNASDMLNLPFLLPPLSEQQKIADFLDEKVKEIDKAIEKTKETIELYKKYKQAVITEAVTKGLDPNVEMKDSGIEWSKKIPKNWKTPEIRYYTKSRSGGTPERLVSEYWDNGTIPWMASGEVNKIHVYDTKEKITKLAVENSNAKLLTKGSVMVALNGQGKTKGMSAILHIEATCNQSLCAFECDSINLYNEYLFYCFQSMYKYLRSQAGDGLRDGLSASFVRHQRIPLPSVKEQKIISKYLNKKCKEIEELISAKQKIINKLDLYKKSLIYEYVTGKKEVK